MSIGEAWASLYLNLNVLDDEINSDDNSMAAMQHSIPAIEYKGRWKRREEGFGDHHPMV